MKGQQVARGKEQEGVVTVLGGERERENEDSKEEKNAHLSLKLIIVFNL